MGLPGRSQAYPEAWQWLNVLSTAGATILGAGWLIAIGYFLWSLKWGNIAGPNPWGAKGLEWEAMGRMPLPHNFDEVPIVTEEAYAYTGKEPMDV